MKKALRGKTLLTYLVLLIFSVVSIYPIVFMMVGSTKSTSEIFSASLSLLPGNEFITNFTNLVNNSYVFNALKNSLFISIVATVLTVYISALAGYAFAKFSFKFKNLLLMILIILMTLPGQVTLIPLFNLINSIGMENTPWAIIFPGVASAMGVFLMKQNMASIPDELIESAKMDGAKEMTIFHRIILPLCKPTIASLSVITFMGQWGNYLWPLIILKDEKSMTLPVILSNMKGAGQTVDYGMLMTGTLVSIIPMFLVFIFLQKYIITGLYSGSIKG